MNLAYLWQLPPWQLVFAPFTLWKPFYRPLAGWLFVPLLSTFGLNPAPFHAVMLLFVLGTAFLTYKLARLLGSGARASWIAAIITCYHPGLKDLYFNTAFIYDALCCFFYISALVYYVRIRRDGSTLQWRQVSTVLVLYVFALNSKEMAVTLPLALLVYECLYQKAVPWQPVSLVNWLRGPGWCILLSVCINLIYLQGRVFGAGGIAHEGTYAPKISMERFWDFQLRASGDLFQKWQWFDRTTIVMIWIVMFYLAWRRPRPVLRFTFLLQLLAPLPIEFIPGRAGACLYIPMVGWAIFLSAVYVDFGDGIGAIISREARWGRSVQPYISNLLLAVGLLVLWIQPNLRMKNDFIDPTTVDLAPATWSTIQQLRQSHLHIPPHSTVVFLDDPLHSYDMSHIAELTFLDRTVRVLLNKQTPLSPEEIARANCILDYKDGQFVQVR